MQQKLDLGGKWTLQQQGKKEQIPVDIPGDNISALMAAGKIPDPYFGLNELAVQWVGQVDWVFSRRFHLPAGFLDQPAVFLYCQSLDTCAEVLLNGRSLGRSRNMFHPFRVEVTEALKQGENEIRLLFRSPEEAAAEYSRQLPYPLPHSRYPVQSPHRNLIRKVQCHGGWDWGPCLMVSGIYGRIYLAACGQGWIEQVYTQQEQSGSSWRIEVISEIFALQAGAGEVAVRLGKAGVRTPVELEGGLNLVRTPLVLQDPELWWPAGYGEQALHELTVQALGDQINKQIGLRRLSLITQEDPVGRSMTFRVNGRDIFCKGANWIPPDALPARQTRARYERLLGAALAANMNMIRLWGGGQYETEDFYRFCDRKGLLVWQDLMFSCATYPATRDFLEKVEAEVAYQVKRLQDHPCIALWCGNNENLGALGWFAESRANQARYLVDYDRLNEGVLGRVVKGLDPGRVWWPSSPCGGEGDYSDNWHDDTKGDMHYWSVWHEGKSFEAYYKVTPRFCSEFGFQSFPSLDTVRSYAPEEQWNITAPVMEHHQRHPRGNSLIMETMTRYFRLAEGFENLLYLSQVQQALAVKTAVEYWRSRRPTCMGTLYWQLNDTWPGASWSSLEYSGKWKLLHYAARKFFAPIHVLAFCKDGESVEVVGVNDGPASSSGRLEIRWMAFSGQILMAEERRVTLPGEAATPLARYPIQSLPGGREEIFLYLTFRQESPGGAAPIANELFLAPPKRCPLEQPALQPLVRHRGGEVTVELTGQRPAFYVSLDLPGIPGIFEDNLFTLLPGTRKVVRFRPEGELLQGAASPAALQKRLRVHHLRGSYH